MIILDPPYYRKVDELGISNGKLKSIMIGEKLIEAIYGVSKADCMVVSICRRIKNT